MAILSGLSPANVFAYFEKLCSIPHGSGNTQQVSELCVRFAREHGLACQQDEHGNIIIRKGGSAGYETAAPVILQAHLDMVCAKTNDCTKDMSREGLDLRTDGEWVWADKTSLGGDDGIGAAMILAILADPALAHPPLEAVLTVDEEVGMAGAAAMDCSSLNGRMLLNLDSEEDGVFTVSCAGGVCVDGRIPADSAPLQSENGCRIVLTGLQGGHSGAEINKGRGSAAALMARVLYAASQRIPGLRLAALTGGRFVNVICPHCTADVAVPAGRADTLTALLGELDAALKKEYAACDAQVQLSTSPCALTRAVSAERSAVLLRALAALPQGITEMDPHFPGLAQSSLNLGILTLEDGVLRIGYCIRSTLDTQKAMLLDRVRAVVELAGGTIRPYGSYPGWPYAQESALRDRVLAAYRSLNGREGRLDATHIGLECGVFLEKLPGLDAVSLGPELHDVHSVRERLNVPSTARTYALVCEVLKRSGTPETEVIR